MTEYKFTYTQQIVISRKEYNRVGKLIESGHRIILIEDVEHNFHLIDWHYVKHNDIEVVKPDSLPGENNEI